MNRFLNPTPEFQQAIKTLFLNGGNEAFVYLGGGFKLRDFALSVSHSFFERRNTKKIRKIRALATVIGFKGKVFVEDENPLHDFRDVDRYIAERDRS